LIPIPQSELEHNGFQGQRCLKTSCQFIDQNNHISQTECQRMNQQKNEAATKQTDKIAREKTTHTWCTSLL
jgi:hypothetical protein